MPRPFQRRALPLLLCLLLLSALLPLGVVSGAPSLPADAASHWAASEIGYAVTAGLMKGYPDNSFRPDQPISRGEVYTLLARQKGLAGGSLTALPAGWATDHWAAPSGAALIQAGILYPVEEPAGGNWDGPISRASLARLLVRVQGGSAPQGVNLLIPDIQGRIDAAWITAAVAQGLMTGFPDGSFGPEASFTRAQTAVVMHRLREPSARPALWREAYRYTLPEGGTVNLQVVRANLRSPKVGLKTLTSSQGVGHTLTLDEMAQSVGAVAAINGTYFSAYNNQAIQDPYGALVRDGRVLHLTGSKRPALGIWPDGRARIDTFSASISGTTNGSTIWPNSWYSYAINHSGTGFGTNWITIMTPDRGSEMGFNDGLSVVVRKGKVTELKQGAVPIPADGFVVSLGGSEQGNFSKTFTVGAPIDYQVRWTEGWSGVSQLVQAGPLMTRQGKIAVDFARDEFFEQKITEWATNRSAVGLTSDGMLLMLIADAAKVTDLASIMLDLGAIDSMCMDSGGSSGLLYKGEYLWRPGRLLTSGIGIVLHDQ